MIPEGTLRAIQDRLDIIEVIGGYVPLKRSGQNVKGLCPFHPEKTPSFVVYPQKQFYICFGCGAAGDLVNFVMKAERLEFPEAVELLAQKAGVPFSWVPGGGEAGSSDRAEMCRAHEVAARLYQTCLLDAPEGRQAREYLQRRGLKPETWKAFRLGYAPDRWDSLLEEATREGLKPELLERSGLAVPRESKAGWYDRFRHRLIFPIGDSRGRLIGFGGRVLDDSTPKYLNSPETELYVKGRVLYGLDRTASEIRGKDFCIVVEGYMDLVSPWQHGIRNVVASMGTSLTEAQVRLIRRHTRHVVMVYDGDYAGEMATLRGLDLFLEAEMRVRVAVLPPGSDPDSLVRERGVEALARALQGSKELFDYKLDLLMREFEPRSLEGRIRICQEMLPTIKRVPNAIQRGEYVRRLGEALGVPEGLLWTELNRVRLGGRKGSAWKPGSLSELPEGTAGKTMDAEGLLAGLLLEDPQRIRQVEGRLELEDLLNPEVKELVSGLLHRWREGSLPEGYRELLSHSPGDASEQARQQRVRWFAWADSMQEKEQALDEVLDRIRERRRRASLDNLRASLRQAEEASDAETAARLLAEINRILKAPVQI